MVESEFVVVGGGLAGAKTVEALREAGYDGSLTLIGEEPHLPYERPPLSKGHLIDGTPLTDFTPLAPDWFTEHGVELVLERQATAIDPGRHTVALADGTQVGYTKLALATGARPRRLDLTGADAEGVRTLRTIEDSDALADAFGPGARVAVIGAGWIGLEAAAAARAAGAEVTVLEAGAQPLERVMGRRVGAAYADLHRAHSVDVRLGVEVAAIRAVDGRVTGVQLGDDSVVEADLVVLGIGVEPNVELAESAGLAVDHGILVDASLRTSDPDIVAVGDVAAHDHPLYGRLRVEHWATALNQPAVAAQTMLGRKAAYERVPYFFTDQYDLGMEYRGVAPDPDNVVIRGDLGGSYLAFWLDDEGRLSAAMNVNDWDHGDELADLVTRRPRVDPTTLADPEAALSGLG